MNMPTAGLYIRQPSTYLHDLCHHRSQGRAEPDTPIPGEFSPSPFSPGRDGSGLAADCTGSRCPRTSQQLSTPRASPPISEWFRPLSHSSSERGIISRVRTGIQWIVGAVFVLLAIGALAAGEGLSGTVRGLLAAAILLATAGLAIPRTGVRIVDARGGTISTPHLAALLIVGLVAGMEIAPAIDTGDSGADDVPAETPTETPMETETDRKTPIATADGELRVHYIDVGQADATFLEFPKGETILMNSGDWRDDGGRVLEYLRERGVERIDHLVSTHAHADHIGGHKAVIETYETDHDGIGAVYDSGSLTPPGRTSSYLDAVERHDVALFEVRKSDEIDVGEAAVEFHNPPAGTGEDLHDNGVALTVEYGE